MGYYELHNLLFLAEEVYGSSDFEMSELEKKASSFAVDCGRCSKSWRTAALGCGYVFANARVHIGILMLVFFTPLAQ